MRQIIAIAWKDAHIAFSQPSQWVFFIVLPLVFTFILGGGFADTADTPVDNRVQLLAVTEARSAAAQSLIDMLGQSSSVQVKVLPQAEADAKFTANQASALLIIPASFDTATLIDGSARLQLKQQSNTLEAPIVERAVENASQQVGAMYQAARNAMAEAERISPFADASARQVYFEQALQLAQTELAHAPTRLSLTRPATTPSQYNQATNTSAGQLVTWVFIPMLGISALFAYERRNGTLRRLLTTPASRPQLLLGTITGQVLTALVQMGLLIGFGIVVMHLPWGQSPIALAALLVAFALAGVALGTTLGTFVKSESQASGLSTLLGMVLALLGGCWYPSEIFPDGVRKAVQVLPTTWAMNGMLDLLTRGVGLQAILPNIAVLLGFAAVFFIVGVARFKFE